MGKVLLYPPFEGVFYNNFYFPVSTLFIYGKKKNQYDNDER